MKKLHAILAVILVLIMVLAACGKSGVSAEKQRILDEYYWKMLWRYPQFLTIQRSRLAENVFISDEDGYMTVNYRVTLGGVTTDYTCYYSQGPAHPNGSWTLTGEEFLPFVKNDISERKMVQIRETLLREISECVTSAKLDDSDLSYDNINLYWEIFDGKLYACSEYIAHATPDTTISYGCSDHAHVFGKVLVEFGTFSVKLTEFAATAG